MAEAIDKQDSLGSFTSDGQLIDHEELFGDKQSSTVNPMQP